MARVEFRTSAVQAHGFPQCCVTCGNDEDGQLVAHKLPGKTPWLAGCGLLFFGPIGWLISIFVFAKFTRKSDLHLPVCRLCKKGLSRLHVRFTLLTLLAIGLCLAPVLEYVPTHSSWFYGGFLIFVYALIEHFWLSPQFLISVDKVTSDTVRVRVANDDYPGLYQRHVDNALLYGSSESQGTRANFE